jgi:hypothetical protein
MIGGWPLLSSAMAWAANSMVAALAEMMSLESMGSHSFLGFVPVQCRVTPVVPQ